MAAVGLVSCGGGQPRVYKVAVNPSALNALPASCFRTGSTSTDTTTFTNAFVDMEWSLWDGPADKQYLDVGTNLVFALGQANAIKICSGAGDSLPCLIEGGPKAFTVSRVAVKNSVSPAETDTRTVTITFDDTPGATAKGTANLKSTYTCSGCNQPSCEVNLPFVARRIDAQATYDARN